MSVIFDPAANINFFKTAKFSNDDRGVLYSILGCCSNTLLYDLINCINLNIISLPDFKSISILTEEKIKEMLLAKLAKNTSTDDIEIFEFFEFLTNFNLGPLYFNTAERHVHYIKAIEIAHGEKEITYYSLQGLRNDFDKVTKSIKMLLGIVDIEEYCKYSAALQPNVTEQLAPVVAMIDRYAKTLPRLDGSFICNKTDIDLQIDLEVSAANQSLSQLFTVDNDNNTGVMDIFDTVLENDDFLTSSAWLGYHDEMYQFIVDISFESDFADSTSWSLKLASMYLISAILRKSTILSQSEILYLENTYKNLHDIISELNRLDNYAAILDQEIPKFIKL